MSSAPSFPKKWSSSLQWSPSRRSGRLRCSGHLPEEVVVFAAVVTFPKKWSLLKGMWALKKNCDENSF
jgi:hypothetical protein